MRVLGFLKNDAQKGGGGVSCPSRERERSPSRKGRLPLEGRENGDLPVLRKGNGPRRHDKKRAETEPGGKERRLHPEGVPSLLRG